MLNKDDSYSRYICYWGMGQRLGIWDRNIKAPMYFKRVQVHERTGVMLRHTAASKANTWQKGGREMLTVTVMTRGTIALFHAIM